jgi:hypothetical protein
MADGSTFSGSGDGVGGAPRVRESAAFEGDLAALVGECPQLGLLYFHALGDGIGLNVHDPTPPTTVMGSAISIEPGIYVRPGHLATLPDTPRNRALIEAVGAAWERHDGIGVRIEDDYLMLPSGLEWISRAPREIDEIEEAMAGARARRAPRP